MQWFCTDADGQVSFFNTEQDVRNAAENALQHERDDAVDGWRDDVENIAWGVVLGECQLEFSHPRTEDDTHVSPDCDEIADYHIVETKLPNRFKEYVHTRLTSMGVPEDPDPERTRETGCRIGSRLNWIAERLKSDTPDTIRVYHGDKFTPPKPYIADGLSYGSGSLRMASRRSPHGTAYHCEHCGGWIEGPPTSRSIDDIGFLCVRKGTAFVCKRCQRELSFVGFMSQPIAERLEAAGH